MVNATSASAPTSLLLTAPAAKANSSNSIDSFAQQLAQTLEGYINQASDSSSIEIDITPKTSQDPGARQFLVTVKPTSITTVADQSASGPVTQAAIAPQQPAATQSETPADA